MRGVATAVPRRRQILAWGFPCRKAQLNDLLVKRPVHSAKSTGASTRSTGSRSAGRQDVARVLLKAPREFRNMLHLQRESRRLRMSAKALEQIADRREGIQQVKALDGTSRTHAHSILNANYQRGTMIPLRHSLRHYADHAAVPAFACQHQRVLFGEVGARLQLGNNRAQDFFFHPLPLAVQAFQPFGDFAGAAASGSVNRSMTSRAFSMRPAAFRRGASRKPTSPALICFAREAGKLNQRGQA